MTQSGVSDVVHQAAIMLRRYSTVCVASTVKATSVGASGHLHQDSKRNTGLLTRLCKAPLRTTSAITLNPGASWRVMSLWTINIEIVEFVN